MPEIKPTHNSAYDPRHTHLCERTLVSLLRGIGPWKQHIYVIGGLVPRYLVERAFPDRPPYVGTQDVDIVLDIEMLATVEAYARIEQNLKRMQFARGSNDDGNAQHFRWSRMIATTEVTIDLLSASTFDQQSGLPQRVPTERRLSTIPIRGAHLLANDHLTINLTEELLDDRGVATETVRFASVVPFIVLKAFAYDQRWAPKDANDLIYVLQHFEDGPASVANAFVQSMMQWPDETLFAEACSILRNRFASDQYTRGFEKDGPVAYAQFLSGAATSQTDTELRRSATAVVERFLAEVDRLRAG